MLTSDSAIVTLSRRVAVVIAVAALFFVPPIVRATSRIKSPAPLRLNRGFETPPSKADAVSANGLPGCFSAQARTAATRPTVTVQPAVARTADQRLPDPARPAGAHAPLTSRVTAVAVSRICCVSRHSANSFAIEGIGIVNS